MKHIESFGIKAFAAACSAAALFWMTYMTISIAVRSQPDSAVSLFFLVWFLGGTWILCLFLLRLGWNAWGYAVNLRHGQWRSEPAIGRLKKIRNDAFIVMGLWILQLPSAYFIAEREDAPGLILFAAALLALPAGVALFAMVLLKTTASDPAA